MNRNEAIKIVKSHYPANKQMLNEALKSLIPELIETEDERIRNFLIDYINHIDWGDWDFSKKQCITWLEKQGNKSNIFIWHDASEEPDEMRELFCEWETDDATWHDIAFYDKKTGKFRQNKMPIDNVIRWVYVDELLEKQGEQKPAWSEEDERLCSCLIKDQEEALDDVYNDKYGHSEIISDLKEKYRERINWLKSIKQRIV